MDTKVIYLAISERAVRLQLAQDVAAAEETEYTDLDNGLHPTVMIINGLTLEDDQ